MFEPGMTSFDELREYKFTLDPAGRIRTLQIDRSNSGASKRALRSL
jgi:hypothetical protein